MGWLIEHLGLIVTLLVGISFVRGLIKAMRAGEKPVKRVPRREDFDPEAAERTRRVQEEIRRKIAERRNATNEHAGEEPPVIVVREPSRETPPPLEPQRERIPPMMRPREVPPVDPFGGPMRKMVRKLEEAAQRRFDPAEDEAAKAALERQRRLAEELRLAEAARAEEQRRAAFLAARRIEEAARSAPAVSSLGEWRGGLRDPRELRRAVVMREILGPPVSLR